MRISWLRTPVTPWDGCETEKPWEEDCVPAEYLCAAGPGYLRAFARLAQRSLQEGVSSRWRTGCMVPVPKKTRVSLSAKNARGVLLACHTGKIHSRIVRTKIQHLLSEAAKGRQFRGIKGGSTSVVLSFFIEKMCKERKCAAVLFTDIKAAFYSVFAEIALGGLLPLDTREQLLDIAGLSGQVRQALCDLLAEDTVVMAQGPEPVWRCAAQDWHISCSFRVKGNECRTMLWSGTRPGDTMADLIAQ